MWTPYQIRIILHHHTTRSEFPENHTKLFAETIARFVDEGLLQRDDEGLVVTTAKASALIDLWRSTPVPVMKWVDPRFEEATDGP
jgi:hypothetical protein